MDYKSNSLNLSDNSQKENNVSQILNIANLPKQTKASYAQTPTQKSKKSWYDIVCKN